MVEAGPYRVAAAVRPERRPVALGLRAQLVLGNRFALIAWCLLMVASPLGWMIAAQTPLCEPTIAGETARTQAVVDGATTHFNFAGEGEERSVRYHFTVFGRRYQGRSWHPRGELRRGNSAAVFYQIDDPRRSVLLGMAETRQDTAALLWFVALTVPTALGLVLIGWLRARRTMRLLAYGRLADRVSFLTTAPIEHSTDSWALHTYQVGDDEPHTCRTRVGKGFDPGRSPRAQILVHPAEPATAILLDTLPGAPRVEDGRLTAKRWPRAMSFALAGLLAMNLVMASIATVIL